MSNVKERRKTHLIYMDVDNHAWIEEHGNGSKHPAHAVFFCEIPPYDGKGWIDGKPRTDNEQFLTLSPFYPSNRLDVEIEINRTPKIMQYENHPAFAGCVKYMPVTALDLRPIPKHIERAIYTIGLCCYGHVEPYKTVEVKADGKMEALKKGREELKPALTEHICYVGVRPNEEYDEHYNKKPSFKR